MKRNWKRLFFALSSVLLTACSAGEARLNDVSLTEPALSDTRAVVYLSPQTGALNEGAPGHVAFVRNDWTFQTLQTSGMDEGMVLWNEAGLSFSDKDSDYLVSDKVAKIPSPKRDFQEGTFFDPSSSSFISLYNEGFSDRGYKEQLIVTSADRSTMTQVEGAYTILGQCEAGIYGVAPRSGRYLSDEEFASMKSGNSNPGQMLTRLYPLQNGTESLISEMASPDTAEPRGTAPCVDGILSYPSFVNGDDGNPQTGRPVLRQWNTRSGTVKDTPLVDSTGQPLNVSIDNVMASSTLGKSDGDILWLLPDGTVMRIKPTSGTASPEYSLELVDNSPYLHSQVSAGSLWILEEPTVKNEEVVINRYDFKDGSLRESHAIPGMAGLLNVDMVLRSFAIAP